VVKEEIDKEINNMGTFVQIYNDIDMKLNVPVLISRPAIINEFKSYVEKSI